MLALLIGAGAGFLNGLIAAGGGVCAVVLLGYFLSMDFHEAKINSLSLIGGCSILGYLLQPRSTWSDSPKIQKDPSALKGAVASFRDWIGKFFAEKEARRYAKWAITGSFVGRILFVIFGHLIPLRWIRVAFAPVMVFAGIFVWRNAQRSVDAAHKNEEKLSSRWLPLIAFNTGLLSELFGISAGFIISGVLNARGLAWNQARRSAYSVMVPLCFAGVCFQFVKAEAFTQINITTALLCVGGLIGQWGGTRVREWYNDRGPTLQYFFAIFIWLMALGYLLGC